MIKYWQITLARIPAPKNLILKLEYPLIQYPFVYIATQLKINSSIRRFSIVSVISTSMSQQLPNCVKGVRTPCARLAKVPTMEPSAPLVWAMPKTQRSASAKTASSNLLSKLRCVSSATKPVKPVIPWHHAQLVRKVITQGKVQQKDVFARRGSTMLVNLYVLFVVRSA